MIVSGKLRAQRAKSMKFKDGYMISSGQPVKEYIDSAVRHVLLRQVCFSSILYIFIYILDHCDCVHTGAYIFIAHHVVDCVCQCNTGCTGYQGQDHA